MSQRAPAPAKPAPRRARVLFSRPGDAAEREADRLADAAVGERGRSHVSRRRADEARAEAAPGVAARLRGLQGRGAPLPAAVRTELGARLSHDFSRVRVHTDAAADEAARGLGAVAFALGHDVVFAAGRYAPETAAGRRLLAHELVHVAQHGDAATWVARASYGVAGPNPRGVLELEGQETVPDEDVAVVRRQPQGTDKGKPPAAATPTISLSPGAALTRGDTLTATVAFTPAAGERMTVTQWSYATAAHGTVARPATDADFQTRWTGVMAVSGTVVLTYRITPAGGSPGAVKIVPKAVTVADRTGAPWVSSVTPDAEETYTGQPSPPELFKHLGHHEGSRAVPPAFTPSPISGGPNAGLAWVSALTAGTYRSTPKIHPDAKTATSAFWSFHLHPSRLYLVPASGPRTLIPPTEYRGLSVTGTRLTFTVPNWERFYKSHNFLHVTAAGGGRQLALTNAEWRLVSNDQRASVRSVDPADVLARLGLGPTDHFVIGVASRGRWEGFQLMQAPAILAGTQSHEYRHPTHSHRANFQKMMRALDPQRKLESTVAPPSAPADYFTARVNTWWSEIIRPDHELVDEAASRTAERFVAAPGTMAGVNTDPASGAILGAVWDITNDRQMT
jgi:hypothetical protein